MVGVVIRWMVVLVRAVRCQLAPFGGAVPLPPPSRVLTDEVYHSRSQNDRGEQVTLAQCDHTVRMQSVGLKLGHHLRQSQVHGRHRRARLRLVVCNFDRGGRCGRARRRGWLKRTLGATFLLSKSTVFRRAAWKPTRIFTRSVSVVSRLFVRLMQLRA